VSTATISGAANHDAVSSVVIRHAASDEVQSEKDHEGKEEARISRINRNGELVTVSKLSWRQSMAAKQFRFHGQLGGRGSPLQCSFRVFED
jgi:hypothetical protein